MAQDAFDHLSDLGPALKLPLEIAFIDQFGQEECVALLRQFVTDIYSFTELV